MMMRMTGLTACTGLGCPFESSSSTTGAGQGRAGEWEMQQEQQQQQVAGIRSHVRRTCVCDERGERQGTLAILPQSSHGCLT